MSQRCFDCESFLTFFSSKILNLLSLETQKKFLDTSRVVPLVAHQLVTPKVGGSNPSKWLLLSWPKRDFSITFVLFELLIWIQKVDKIWFETTWLCKPVCGKLRQIGMPIWGSSSRQFSKLWNLSVFFLCWSS